MATKPYHDEEWLRELYVDEGLDLQEIADRVGCSKDTIWRWKNKHGIKKPWKVKENLKKLYVEQQMPMKEVAEELGCSTQTIKNQLDKHNIDTRDESFRRNPGSFGIYINNWGHEHINHQYKGEQFSVLVHRLISVATYGVEDVKDKHVHHKNNIPWDNRPENLEVVNELEHTARHHDTDTPWRDKDKLIEVYEKHNSCRKAASELGCSPKTIHNWLNRFGHDISPR